MEKSGAKAYLVNTGWNGTGKRISIKDTRGIIDAILSGAINEAPSRTSPRTKATSTARLWSLPARSCNFCCKFCAQAA